MLHRRMVCRGEHEAHTHGVNASTHLLRRQVDIGSQGFEHIRAARFGRHGAIPVLGHACSRRRANKDGRSRNVERMRAIPAGAHHIDKMGRVAHIDPGCQFAHHLGGGGDLADGLLLHAQAGNECGDQHRRHFPTHDLSHQIEHLVVKDLSMVDDAG